MSDWAPLDLDSVEEIIAVVADDEDTKRNTSPEAESGEGSGSEQCACVGCSEGNPCTPIDYKACICDACESEEDFGTCWHCDDAKCDGECTK